MHKRYQMNKNIFFLQYINMKTNYKINNNELIINLNFFYEFLDNQNDINNIRNYINNIIISNNLNFNGNRIIIYKDGVLFGNIYLANYYLKKKDNYLTELNSYFEKNSYLELN